MGRSPAPSPGHRGGRSHAAPAARNWQTPTRRRAVEPCRSELVIDRSRRLVSEHGRQRVDESNFAAPARRSASWTSGRSASSSSRSPGMRLWGWRNCATPLRVQFSHASCGESGTGLASRSRTVTSFPSRASNMAAPSPQIPPPMIRMFIASIIAIEARVARALAHQFRVVGIRLAGPRGGGS